METALSWLNDIIQALLTLLPRRVIIPVTEAGIKHKHGRATLVQPGTCWYWPLFTTVFTSEVILQTIDLPGQSYLTADNKAVALSGTIVYRITDPLKAFTAVSDLDASISNVARCAIIEALRGMTLQGMYEGRDDIDKKLRSSVAASVSGWGVKILTARLTDLAPCRVIRLVGDTVPAAQSAE